MSGDLAEDGFAEPTRSAERPEAAAHAAATGGGGGVAGVSAGAAEPVVSVATGNFTASLPADALSTSIQELKAKQKQLREEKQQLAKELRNQERRKKRLRARARQMTDEDLVQVLMLRKRQKQDQEEKKKGARHRGSGIVCPVDAVGLEQHRFVQCCRQHPQQLRPSPASRLSCTSS